MKAKKWIVTLTLALMLAATVSVAFGCGSKNKTGIEILPGSFDTVYLVGELVDYGDVGVRVRDGKKTVEVHYFDTVGTVKPMKITLNTDVPGAAQATVTYDGQTASVDVSVQAPTPENCELKGFAEPDNLKVFKGLPSSADFKDRVDEAPLVYHVGIDNAYRLQPDVMVQKKVGGGLPLPQTMSAFPSTVTL
ncbi:MAG: hypothetical protein LBM78_02715, partial [Clostridiales bacterium]|nr:hypothetical protein [Clostridiales bacterium]